MLHAIDHLGLSLHVEARTAPSVGVDASKCSTRLIAKDHRLILLLHLAQFVIPRCLLFHTLNAELPSQWRRGISGPYDLADGLVAAAFDHHEIANVQIA